MILKKIGKKWEYMVAKCINNYTEEELKQMLPQIPYEKIHIVYEYYHKPRNMNVYNFAKKHCIGTTTLYRYIHEIKLILNKSSIVTNKV